MPASGTAFSKAPGSTDYDAVVIGSGPNGFAAGITLARAGLSVALFEAKETPGGGMRSGELTEPGFIHDICSAVHPLAVSSPFFRSFEPGGLGVTWVHPDLPLAHPLDHGRAAVMARSATETAAGLPAPDDGRYAALFEPLARKAPALFSDLLGPLPFPPRHPFLMARFARHAFRSGESFARSAFRSEEARALFAGNAAHSVQPLDQPFTAAAGTLLGVSGHHAGWPFARGGTQAIADALARQFTELGGEIVCPFEVRSLDELPQARAILFDTSPGALASIAGEALPPAYRNKLLRYRYGPAAFKLDLALSHPIPWRNEACRRAGTVHVGGTLEEISASERDAWEGRSSERPFVLVAQPSVFDRSRAPSGKHTAWVYCHVPHGAKSNMTGPILDQVERFAPGFRDTILAMHTSSPSDFESYNANYVGGDIIGGVQDLAQMFTRPVARWNPYTTPNPRLFICSSSTPPGAGVHGMCGYHAARAALKRVFS